MTWAMPALGRVSVQGASRATPGPVTSRQAVQRCPDASCAASGHRGMDLLPGPVLADELVQGRHAEEEEGPAGSHGPGQGMALHERQEARNYAQAS